MTKRSKKVKKSPRKSIRQKSMILKEKINFDSLHSTSSSSDSAVSGAPQNIENNATPLTMAVTAADDLEGSSSEEDSKELIANPPIQSLAEDVDYLKNFFLLPDMNSIKEDTRIPVTIMENGTEPLKKDMEGIVPSPKVFKLKHLVKFSSQIALVEASPDASEEQSFELDDVLSEDFTQQTTKNEMETEKTEALLNKLFRLSLKEVENIDQEIDFEDLAKQREHEQLQQQILKFINDLVEKVIEKAEFHSNELDLRQKLDKHKLLDEIFSLYRKTEEEQSISKLLNGKLTRFCKRRNMHRQIQPDSPKYMAQEKEKYLKALKHLDDVLGRKKNVEDSLSHTIMQLNDEFLERKQKIQNEILLFEGEVKKHLCRAGSTQLNAHIENLLKTMAKTRTELSDLRLQMILKQDSYAELLNKVSHLEDLGNGITLNHYNRIQNENISLEKKIEESNAALKKLHHRFHKSLHFLAHVKEKQRIARSAFAKQFSDYEKLNNEYSSLRAYFHQLKLKSGQIHKEIEKLNIKSGMLNKPALLYDYDQTVERLSEQRVIVESLRSQLDMIQQDIVKLENQLIRVKKIIVL